VQPRAGSLRLGGGLSDDDTVKPLIHPLLAHREMLLSRAARRAAWGPTRGNTFAIVMPLTRLFFEPQNTIAISSARENPNQRAMQAVAVSIGAKSAASITTSIASDPGASGSQIPPTVAALNTV